MKPGIYDNVPEAQYHASPGISKHALDLIAQNPMKYMHALNEPREPSAAMKAGSLLHCMVLEPDQVEQKFVIAPEVNKRTKEGRATLAYFETENAEKTVLTPAEWETAEGMATAVKEHPLASVIFGDGRPEVSICWNDPETGSLCRSRIDWIPNGLNCLVDLKSAIDASFSAFARAAKNYRYHVQDAFYCEGAQQVGLTSYDRFLFVVVENKPPYCVALYELDAEARNTGRQLFRRDLRTYSECLKQQIWPGYPEGVRILSLPKWENIS